MELQQDLIDAVANGADIYNYTDAGVLRQLEREHPEYIDIGEARAYMGDGADQMPYFGAILTRKGRVALLSSPNAHESISGIPNRAIRAFQEAGIETWSDVELALKSKKEIKGVGSATKELCEAIIRDIKVKRRV